MSTLMLVLALMRNVSAAKYIADHTAATLKRSLRPFSAQAEVAIRDTSCVRHIHQDYACASGDLESSAGTRTKSNLQTEQTF